MHVYEFLAVALSLNFSPQISHSSPDSASDDDEERPFMRFVCDDFAAGDFAVDGVCVVDFDVDDFTARVFAEGCSFDDGADVGGSFSLFCFLASFSSIAAFRFCCFSFIAATFSGEIKNCLCRSIKP